MARGEMRADRLGSGIVRPVRDVVRTDGALFASDRGIALAGPLAASQVRAQRRRQSIASVVFSHAPPVPHRPRVDNPARLVS